MAETNVKIKQIEKLKVSGQVVEEKDSEGEVIKQYMTTVAFLGADFMQKENRV